MVIEVAIDGRVLRVPLKRVRGRTTSIGMTPWGPIVRAPHRMPLGQIERFVVGYAPRIAAQIKAWPVKPHEFFWRGERRRLLLAPEPARWHDRVLVARDQAEAIRFLRSRATERLPGIAIHWSSVMREQCPWIGIGEFRTRWGSCTSKTRRVRLNWRLAMCPDWVADAIVIHELAHLAEPNHGRGFWTRVHEFDSHPERTDAWLKAHGNEVLGWPPPPRSAFLA